MKASKAQTQLEERVQAAHDAYRNATDPTDRRRKFDTFRAVRDRLERGIFKKRFNA